MTDEVGSRSISDAADTSGRRILVQARILGRGWLSHADGWGWSSWGEGGMGVIVLVSRVQSRHKERIGSIEKVSHDHYRQGSHK